MSFCIIIAGFCCIVTPVAAQKIGMMSTVQELDTSVVIVTAYYCDADGEDYENDIVGRFNIILNGAQRYNLDLEISLTMPSGLTHVHSQSIQGTEATLRCTIYFYDYATESGDYTLAVESVVNNCGTAYDNAELTFDPPGGSGDADPVSYLMF
jgi:hypothetical protein